MASGKINKVEGGEREVRSGPGKRVLVFCSNGHGVVLGDDRFRGTLQEDYIRYARWNSAYSGPPDPIVRKESSSMGRLQAYKNLLRKPFEQQLIT